jgi:hypothetical protein
VPTRGPATVLATGAAPTRVPNCADRPGVPIRITVDGARAQNTPVESHAPLEGGFDSAWSHDGKPRCGRLVLVTCAGKLVGHNYLDNAFVCALPDQ